MLIPVVQSLGGGVAQVDANRSLPGDDLVPNPKTGYTQAISINAPRSEVWPWLMQIGYKRAGWYSYDFLHRLMGIAGNVDDEHRSAERIIPDLQNLTIGDTIEIAPGMGYAVVAMEPEQVLITLSILDMDSWQAVPEHDPLPEKYLRSSWVWFLEEAGEETTRLIVRVRSDCSPGLVSTLGTVVSNAGGKLLMQPKTLRGIKRRAEMPSG